MKASGDEPFLFVTIYVDACGIIATAEDIKEVFGALSKS
jgi:hypothetical protein